MIKVGVLGASGYGGVELLRLCASHPDLQVVVATGDSQAGTRAAELYPSLAAAYPELQFTKVGADDLEALDGLDLVLMALPHGVSGELLPALRNRVGYVVDLGADFRLRDPGLYPHWYGHPHPHPELIAEVAFGIPELFRTDIAEKKLVAAAGCYVTAAGLALAPFTRAGAIEPAGIIVDGVSGVSGAGRGLKHSSHFGTVNEDFTAYGLLDHRHTPEIEQAIGAQVLFTPHLAPMTRGILATCYARPTASGPATTEDALARLREFYAEEPFVVITDASPSTKATLGSNTVHITARVDDRTGWLVVISALDNLVKGAAGQMIQCANVLLDLPETRGLPVAGVYP